MKTFGFFDKLLTAAFAVVLVAPALAADDEPAKEKKARPEGREAERPPGGVDSERVRPLMQELERLIRAGRDEEAQRVTKELGELTMGHPEAAERVENAIREFKRQHRYGAGHGQPEGDVRGGPAHGKKASPPHGESGQHPPGSPMAGREKDGPMAKVRHLLEAAEHLQSAGMGDLAQKLRHEAESIERHVHEARHPGGHAGPGMMPEMMERMEKLQNEVNELRQQVRQLHDLMAREAQGRLEGPTPEQKQKESAREERQGGEEERQEVIDRLLERAKETRKEKARGNRERERVIREGAPGSTEAKVPREGREGEGKTKAIEDEKPREREATESDEPAPSDEEEATKEIEIR